MRPLRIIVLLGAFFALTIAVCLAQFRRGDGRWWGGNNSGPWIQTEGREWINEDTVRTARETARHSVGFDNWTNAPGFEKDVFTFTRAIFKSAPGRPPWFGWVNDYPDSDLNLSYRLQQLTSMKVDPDGRVLKLTSPDLFSYPMIHMAKPGWMELTEDEVLALRKYLKAGGAIMADDFWGSDEWANFEYQISRILPGHAWIELPMEHPIFHCVFDLKGPKNKLQVPYFRAGLSSLNPDSPNYGNSAQYAGEDYQEMHVRAWLDDHDRIMIIATHNTNNGDGWEREGENIEYFREYSENRAYPLAINIIFYLMTH
ncbi:MAG TPA: DUF4159 domain-containing protein [Verrucomicrobia bacterium]|nr:DUF4159 domain-containing protein [Verrucomicrobiota bacterium]HOP95978.1 DUF4159 domain-containing protein [Verrucomicrobiota bacterium]